MSNLIYILLGVIFLIVLALCFFIFKIYSLIKKPDEINTERRMTDIIMDLKDSSYKNTLGINSQIGSVVKETSEVKEFLRQTNMKMKELSKFQDLFKTPKLRGEWGESQLYYLLRQYYSDNLYETQYMFSSGEKVDAIFYLPDKKILPIDSKFPSENFVKYLETQDEEERKKYMKLFLSDVKKRIDEISSKYILPSENTVDYAIMYVPAEAIYYEMVNNMSSTILDYAWNKKIIITSPNTLFLTLRVIEHWFKDTKLSKETHLILKKISKINEDAVKLQEGFDKLGKHLSNANSAYESVVKRVELLNNKILKITDVSIQDIDNDEINKLNE